jgi:hypothetical protein
MLSTPGASDPRSEPSRGEKRKDGHSGTPSPYTTLAQGLSPMLDGDVLHPFCQQNLAWDDLWLEQDHVSDLRVFVNGLRDKLNNDADVQAVSEVGSFIMLLKKNTRSFQHKVDWKSPSSRVRTVIDRASRANAPIVASTPAKKQGKQPRRSSAGIGRDLSEPLPGFAVEWNVEADSSWVWSQNQEGAAKSDPELLARLLQQSGWLHDKSDYYLAEGKKVVPSEVMASVRLTRSSWPPTTHLLLKPPTKVAKAREKGSLKGYECRKGILFMGNRSSSIPPRRR